MSQRSSVRHLDAELVSTVAGMTATPTSAGADAAWCGQRSRVRTIAIGAIAAGTLSGLPSATHALVTGRNLLESTRAAGTLIPGRQRPGLVAGVAVHVVLSGFWAAVVGTISSRRRIRPVEGAVVGLAIAALDLGVVGRRYPAIKALPQVPQWLDHAVFGAVLAATLQRLQQGSGRTDEGSSRTGCDRLVQQSG